jgi:microcystin-dependent protein
MSDPFVGEIRIFGFNFAPVGWALCAGQLLAISQNAALFSILGTTYGGDGRSTFALPNFEGNVPVGFGQGSGLTEYSLGETGGSQSVTLLDTENPAHNHLLAATDVAGSQPSAANHIYAKGQWQSGTDTGPIDVYAPGQPAAILNSLAIGTAGGSLPHNNLMPLLTVNFCIALQGIFPPRG